MSTQSENKQEIFYHYTSQAGIIGICSSKTLWASSIHHLNDRKEFKLGLDMARAAFADAGRQKDEVTQRFCIEASESLERIDGLHLFVASFSKKDDSLSQWRGYGGGAAAVAIGLTKERIDAMANASRFRFRPCMYRLVDQERLVAEIVRQCLLHFHERRSAKNFSYENSREELLHYAMGNIAAVAPLMKHQSFEEEEEWRLVSEPMSFEKCGVRPGTDFLVPYFEVPLEVNENGVLVFDKVVIGPSAEPQLAERGLLAVFASRKTSWHRMRTTDCPYRV